MLTRCLKMNSEMIGKINLLFGITVGVLETLPVTTNLENCTVQLYFKVNCIMLPRI